MSASTTSPETTYTCSRCGAPLDVGPGTIISVCRYCGYPNIISSTIDVRDVYIVPTQPRDYVIGAFQRLARTDPDLSSLNLEILEVEGVYFPAWYAQIHVSGLVSWYERVQVKEGDTYRTETRYYREKIDREHIFYLPARNQVTGAGTYNALAHYASQMTGLLPLEEASRRYNWEAIRLEFLGVDMDKQRALEAVRDDAVDSLRREYRSRGDGIDFFEAHVDAIRWMRLVYLPIWEVVYTFQDNSYLAVFTGWDLSCVYRTEPITPTQRAERIGVASLISLISGPLSGLAVKMSSNSSFPFILPFILAGAAYASSKSAFKGARVEE